MGLLANGNIMELPDFIHLKKGKNYDITQGYVSVDKLLCDIVSQVRKRKPSWKFELKNSRRTTFQLNNGIRDVNPPTYYTYDSVDVTDEDQKIGNITIKEGHNTRKCRTEMLIMVQSPRIKKLRRGDVVTTYKPDVAIKTILTKMYKLSIVEYGSKLVNEATAELGRACRERRVQINNIHSNLPLGARLRLLLEHMDTFKEYLPKDKDNLRVQCDNLKTLTHEIEIISELENNPAIVIDINNQCLRVFSLIADNECTYRGDVSGNDLPEHIRERLGMLKLVDVGMCIAGKGQRSGNSTYLVTVTHDEYDELEKTNG